MEGKKARQERGGRGRLRGCWIRYITYHFDYLQASVNLPLLCAQIQPDLIKLDPSFVGSLAPPSKLTTAIDGNGSPTSNTPYARLPHLDRLRASGKVDSTEEHSDSDDEGEEEGGDGGEAKKKDRAEREKRRMRGNRGRV